MGLHQLISYLFIVIVAQAFFITYAFDLGGSYSRRSQVNPGSREIQQSFYSAQKKPNVLNPTNTTKQSPYYWNRNRARFIQNDYKESNIPWQNPKVVTNMETTNTVKRRSYISLVSRHKLRSTTPSYIEFDYLDEDKGEMNSSSKRLHRVDPYGVDTSKTRLPFIMRSSSALHHLNDPYDKRELFIRFKPNPPKILRENSYSRAPAMTKFNIKNVVSTEPDYRFSDINSDMDFFGRKHVTGKLYLKGTQVPTINSNTTLRLPIKTTTPASIRTTSFTTLDDRVKFFEMYDTNTLRSPKSKTKFSSESVLQQRTALTQRKIAKDTNNSNKPRRFDNQNKAFLERKYKNFKKRAFSAENNFAISNKIDDTKVMKSSHTHTHSANSTLLFSKSKLLTKIAVAQWSRYPFASVYIYKPTQTHCDAAGISPHWLLAAGSCLSRHDLVYAIDERSAYVTYCGEHWRLPERIAYVKRSVVHPKFNPKDKVRRLLYNIGLIQVSSSMATSCPRWAPIALMSHQLTANPEGTVASAVGWGLDRYGSKYMTERLPHWPLTVYDALVYRETCPGSFTFSTAKHQEDSGASNVYCLLLPPYAGEETDPVHGGLLLVGGKLVAVYLQEERRTRGIQSAQYTGVWGLFPWITDVAIEPDDAEITLDV